MSGFFRISLKSSINLFVIISQMYLPVSLSQFTANTFVFANSNFFCLWVHVLPSSSIFSFDDDISFKNYTLKYFLLFLLLLRFCQFSGIFENQCEEWSLLGNIAGNVSLLDPIRFRCYIWHTVKPQWFKTLDADDWIILLFMQGEYLHLSTHFTSL